MKRNFEVLLPENAAVGFRPGDDAAHRAAAALADRADAPTLQAVATMLDFLERIGGQFHVVALREEVGEKEFATTGVAFMYETVDARIMVAEPPETIFSGIPVSDSQGPPTEIHAEFEDGKTPPDEPTDDPQPESEPDEAAEEQVALTE